MKKIWILTDDRAGNNTQVIGIADALGLPYEEKKLSYNSLIKLPNFLRGASLVGVENNLILGENLPDILISAGRRQAPVAKYIKKKSGGKTKLIHLMNPDCSFADFDLVILPEHDASKKNNPKNVIYTIGSPNRITKEKIENEAENWKGEFENLSSPKIGVLIGGDSKHGKFTHQDTDELVAKINQITGDNSLLITTSRRTPEYTISQMSDIECPKFFYKYQPDTANPYLGILGTADILIVTGDSVAMCAEACATGKPVYIFTPSNAPKKHRKFIASLFEKGYAKPLENSLSHYEYEPLNEAKKVADIIKIKY